MNAKYRADFYFFFVHFLLFKLKLMNCKQKRIHGSSQFRCMIPLYALMFHAHAEFICEYWIHFILQIFICFASLRFVSFQFVSAVHGISAFLFYFEFCSIFISSKYFLLCAFSHSFGALGVCVCVGKNSLWFANVNYLYVFIAYSDFVLCVVCINMCDRWWMQCVICNYS